MERRFDMTNFEQSLRGHADQFIMLPSKRVWHGIYNDLHPGSRWPSIAMGLVFLFTLLGIGHLNNTPKQFAGINPASEKNESGINSQRQIAVVSSSEKNKRRVNSQKQIVNINSVSKKNKSGINSDKVDLQNANVTSESKENSKLNVIPNITAKVIQLYLNGINLKNNIKKGNLIQSNSPANDKINKNNQGTIILNSQENNFNVQHLPQQKINTINNNDELLNKADNSDVVTNNVAINNELIFTINNEAPNNLMEIFSQEPVQPIEIHLEKNTIEEQMQIINNVEKKKENQPENKKPSHILKKRNEKIKWVYFITPSVTTASFIGKGFQPNANPNLSPIIIQPNQNGNGMVYNARLGYEVGTQMTYAFSKEWQFVTGANLSYSGYNVISNQAHPTFATLLLKDKFTGLPYTQSYITHYGNGQGQNQISLRNYSLQFSLPVGLQYALFENSKIQINFASTIEPSLVLKSNAFIISSDGRNYVSDPSLLRKLNLSSNFGSFVTFKSNKIKWQVGPSVRYQLLSTYQKKYPIKEHLIDYGIRIGISK